MKLKLDYDHEQGHWIVGPGNWRWPRALNDPSLPDIELSDADYQDYLDVHRRCDEWQARMTRMWDAAVEKNK